MGEWRTYWHHADEEQSRLQELCRGGGRPFTVRAWARPITLDPRVIFLVVYERHYCLWCIRIRSRSVRASPVFLSRRHDSSTSPAFIARLRLAAMKTFSSTICGVNLDHRDRLRQVGKDAVFIDKTSIGHRVADDRPFES